MNQCVACNHRWEGHHSDVCPRCVAPWQDPDPVDAPDGKCFAIDGVVIEGAAIMAERLDQPLESLEVTPGGITLKFYPPTKSSPEDDISDEDVLEAIREAAKGAPDGASSTDTYDPDAGRAAWDASRKAGEKMIADREKRGEE